MPGCPDARFGFYSPRISEQVFSAQGFAPCLSLWKSVMLAVEHHAERKGGAEGSPFGAGGLETPVVPLRIQELLGLPIIDRMLCF